MTATASPAIVRDSLFFQVDFANQKSISGTSLTDTFGNPITLVNASANTLTVSGGSASFVPPDATSTATYYSIPHTGFTTYKNEITWEAVMNPTTDFGNPNYVRGVSPRTSETGSPLGFGLYAGGIKMEVNTSVQWYTSSASVTSVQFGQWVHVIQTTSITSLQMLTYVNGILVATLPFTGTPTASAGMLIGQGYYSGAKNYSGRVAFVRCHSRALTAAEVQTNFNATRGRFGL